MPVPDRRPTDDQEAAQPRRPAIFTQLPVSTTIATTARTRPTAGPVPPLGTLTWRDQIAHTPLTTENPQPTAQVKAAAQCRPASATADPRTPNSTAVQVNSRGSSPR